MRIVIAHNSYLQRGGEDVSFEAEAELLQDRGHRVSRFSLSNDQIHSMGQVSLAVTTLWNQRASAQIETLIQRHKPDVVHLHNTFPLLSPSVAATARGAGIPVVQTLHNYRLVCPNAQLFRDGKICDECTARSVAWPGVLHRCYRNSAAASAVVALSIVEQRMLRRWRRAADVYVVLTEDSRRRLAAAGIQEDHIMVKPNFLPVDPGVGDGDGGYAMFAGRLSPEKGIHTLLEAWSRIAAPIALKIAGSGPLESLVENAARRDSRIDYLGWRERGDVLQLLKQAAVLIFPSQWYEGLPQTIIESFAVGTPVVASRLGAMREVIDNGETGLLFTPGDPAELATTVTSAFVNPIDRSRMRSNARRVFETRFTAELNYQVLVGIYARAREISRSNNVARSSTSAVPVE